MDKGSPSNAWMNLWFVPGITVFVGIFSLSTFLSFPVQVEGVSFFDKIQHTFAYFVLTSSFLVAFRQTARYTRSNVRKLIVLSSLYGFLLEVAQYAFFPNRYFEWIDA
ncbi:MAG: VanZ family protein, partial [Ekhidna sp.]|nr:VanZ family protein [Ekhidna sp.]